MVTSGTAAKHTGLNNQVFGSNDINPLFLTPCWNSEERRVHDGRFESPPCLCTLTEDVFTQAQVQANGRGVVENKQLDLSRSESGGRGTTQTEQTQSSSGRQQGPGGTY